MSCISIIYLKKSASSKAPINKSINIATIVLKIAIIGTKKIIAKVSNIICLPYY